MTKLLNTNLSCRSNNFCGLLVVIIITTLYLSAIFPAGFITGTSSYWLAQNEDITQYISGFNAYFGEEWHFPLFTIESINYPQGTRSTFVDIIPIYSLLLKLFVPDSFFPFNPFGYWIAISFILQSMAAWLILKTIKLESWIALITLTVFVIIFPALLARIGHISLMSHWLILFSFVIYLRHKAKSLQVVEWTILLFVAFYINIYIFTMIFSIFIATITQFWKINTLQNNLLQLFIPTTLIAISLFLTIFPLHAGGIVQDYGWGYYSMNILSPFDGGKIIKLIDVSMPGQYEGFNYLGLGVILLGIYALRLQRQYDKIFFKRHKFIVILFILFSVYSLSNEIYFGTTHIMTIYYPDFLDTLVHQFRASGRFFWPVGYAIIVFSVIIVLKHSNKKAIFIILMALIIQIVDLSDRLKNFKHTSTRVSEQIIDQQKWNQIIKNNIKNIYFYPKFRCAKNSSPHKTLLPLMIFASERKINLNTGYIARYKPLCTDISEEINNSNQKDSVYIFAKKDYAIEQIVGTYFLSNSDIKCENLDFAYICKNNKIIK